MTKELQVLRQWEVGMEVFVCGPNESISKITKITDAWGGTIFVNKLKFDENGFQRTPDMWSYFIKPLTQTLRDNFEIKLRKKKLTRFDFNSLTNDQIDSIVFFMREKGIKI